MSDRAPSEMTVYLLEVGCYQDRDVAVAMSLGCMPRLRPQWMLIDPYLAELFEAGNMGGELANSGRTRGTAMSDLSKLSYCEFCGWADHSTLACKEHLVLVSIKGLKMLYECAKSYDVRIPEDGHNSWAEPFRQAIADDDAPG